VTTSSITFAPGEVSAYYAARVPDVKPCPAVEWRGPCPIHNGTRDSFAINSETGQWFCHSQCARGGDILDLEMELTGANFKTAKTEVFRIIGREEERKPRIMAEYNYVDEKGELLYQVLRHDPKGFSQRRPDGAGGWIWNLKSVRRVPYHLPELLEAAIVFIAEGEKDVDVLREFGFSATCNSGGAGKWRPEFNQLFSGKEVCILPDSDPAGWRHALDIARNLVGIAAKVQIMELPGRERRRGVV
jgi:putative DNA primase/helicase